MSRTYGHLTGWARHQHFGLRWEWLNIYFRDPEALQTTWHLGSRQIMSLSEWLITTGLLARNRDRSRFGDQFAAAWPEPGWLWQVMWVNVVFNLTTAFWYVMCVGTGEWTTTELRSKLEDSVPRLSRRTASNAIQGLVGLLEQTPIGNKLGQGLVEPTRPRTIRRVGLPSPHPIALAHATRRLLTQTRRTELSFDEDALWPWTVFGCEEYEALALLRSSSQPWLRVDDTGVTTYLALEDLPDVAIF